MFSFLWQKANKTSFSLSHRAGCAGAISSRPAPEGWSGGYVLVDDTLSALQELAANVRDRFEGPVVGITGSVGKTTTRSLTGVKLPLPPL